MVLTRVHDFSLVCQGFVMLHLGDGAGLVKADLTSLPFSCVSGGERDPSGSLGGHNIAWVVLTSSTPRMSYCEALTPRRRTAVESLRIQISSML
jgi:hypothetical protein